MATAIAPRWRMLVILAAWSGLRWGELVGLTRRRVDLLHGTISVVEQLVETDAGVHRGPPKTDAGRREVHVPPHLLPELAAHLDEWVGATTKELMTRMGHSSPRAALIYQHAAADRDQAIAEALSALVRPVEPVQLQSGL